MKKRFMLAPGQDTFTVSSGPLEGRVFVRNESYCESMIPEHEKHRFVEVPASAPAQDPKPAPAEPKKTPAGKPGRKTGKE